MGQLLGFFHSDDSDGIFDIDLQMRQDWLVVAPSSKMYIASSVFFHKDGGENGAVTNCMSHFLILFPTKATVKLANKKRDITEELGLFYVFFLTFLFYIQCDYFNIFQVALPTLYHQVP